MRTSKISSGYRLWILVFAVSLLLLIALSRLWFRGYLSSSTTTINEKFQSPVTVSLSGQAHSHGDDTPVLAYWVCGTSGDSERMLRLLKAIYHPRNQYLLQLDAETSDEERAGLVVSVQSERVFEDFGNVNVVGKSYAINQMGSSALAATLHATALLLKLSADWDWFINLSPSDYPLLSQDDLRHALNSVPRNLNFIHYSSNINDPKERHKMNQVVVDPSLYLKERSHLFYAVETRTTPDAFRIFGGSPWVVLTRDVVEYCVQGWDNLPRKVLMYLSNTASPLESYFHTVLGNSPEFRNRTINNNLRYDMLQKASNGESWNCQEMVASGAAFARPFKESDAVLNEIDEKVLNRLPNGLVPGSWCKQQGMNENSENEENPCSSWNNNDGVREAWGGLKKLQVLLSKLGIEERL